LVRKLDTAMRSGSYKATVWKELTGKNLDELWTAYGQSQAG
jgi:hypothetical protein